MTPSILFTSAGRRVELLRLFRDSIKNLHSDFRIVCTDIDKLAPALQIADVSYLVPRSTDPNYVPTLLRLCQKEDVRAIFPLIDPDIPILAGAIDEFARLGTRVGTGSLAASECTGDKWLTTQFFDRIVLPSPLSWLPADLVRINPQFPLFIKPRRGSAGKGAYKVGTHEELAFFLKRVDDPIIQQFVDGAEITTDVTCDLDGNILAIVSRRRMEVRSGEVSKGETVFVQEILESCIQIAKALPAIGPITVQCIMQENKPYFTEINARFGGGVPLAAAAGADITTWILQHIAGLPVVNLPLGTYTRGVFMTRYDDSFFLTEADCDKLASNCI
jgi:carbamoyl-phosphate synthase large subunit